MRRELPPALRWALLAILGLLVAVAVGIAASELTSRRIGLSSEPIRAGDALAPAPERSSREHPDAHRPGERGHQPTDTAPPATEPTEPPAATTVPQAEGESGTTAPEAQLEGETGDGDD